MAVVTAPNAVAPQLGVPSMLQGKTRDLPCFDDGIHDGISEISVAVSDAGINSITTIYRDGAICSHGGPGGTRHTISFKRRGEILLQVCETICIRGKRPIVKSLTFITNRKTYGPFGRPSQIHFTFPAPPRSICGFGGFSTDFLHFLDGHACEKGSS